MYWKLVFSTFQPRNPTGPLEMKSYLGSISDETEHEDLMSKLKPCFKCKAEKTIDSNNTPLDRYFII